MIAFIFFTALLLSVYIVFPKPTKGLHTTYDAILILGCPALDDGSISPYLKERCEYAFKLYQDGFAPVIIVSGAAVKNHYLEADIMEQYLHKLNADIPILKETKARNTFQNLKLVKDTYPCNNILVVTSPSHIRRAAFFTRKFFRESSVVKCKQHDAVHDYLFEYTRLWICLYYEIKLTLKNKVYTKE